MLSMAIAVAQRLAQPASRQLGAGGALAVYFLN